MKKKDKTALGYLVGMLIGLSIGLSFFASMGSAYLWIPVGVGLGLCFGPAFARLFNKGDKDEDDKDDKDNDEADADKKE